MKLVMVWEEEGHVRLREEQQQQKQGLGRCVGKERTMRRGRGCKEEDERLVMRHKGKVNWEYIFILRQRRYILVYENSVEGNNNNKP